MKTILIILLASISYSPSKEYNLKIENFEIKESLTNNNKIAIIASDSLNNADERINGTFIFTINGFEKSLVFNNGVAVHSDPIEGSIFVYFKHKNQSKTIGHLYFLLHKKTEITPIKVNGLLLILIPIFLLLLAYIFKRFITTFIVLIILYGYFSYSKGLTISHLMESTIELVKSIF